MPRHVHPFDEYHHFGDDLDTSSFLISAITSGATIPANTDIHAYLVALLEYVTDLEVTQYNWFLANAVIKATITPASQGDVWTFYPRTIGTDDQFDAAYDITYGEGYWVMSLASGVHYSPDATDNNSWVGPVDVDSRLLFNLKYNGTDRWVGVGAQRVVATATTAAGPWTIQQFSPDFPTFPNDFGQWEGVEYGNGLWTIVGGIGTTQGNGGYYTSTDGENWTARSGIPWGRYTFAIKYAAGLWVAVGYGQDGSGSGGIATTTDPTSGSWTLRYATNTTPIGQFLTDIDYGDGLWTAAGLQIGGGGGPIVVTSTDGVTWTPRVVGDFTMLAGDVQGIAYGGGNWVLVGRADNFDTDVKIYHAADPRVDTFLAADGAVENTHNWAAHYENGIWAVIGEDDDIAEVHLVTTADPTSLAPTIDAYIVITGSASFTADAVILGGGAGSFTVDASISNAIAGFFTVSAVTAVVVAGSFTVDASLVVSVAGSLTADATISRTQTGSLTADAVRRQVVSGAFTVDASTTNAIIGNFNANAVILATMAGSATANAVINRTQVGSLTADAAIRRAQTGSFTVNAFIPGRFTVDAVIDAGGGAEDFQSDAFQGDTFE